MIMKKTDAFEVSSILLDSLKEVSEVFQIVEEGGDYYSVNFKGKTYETLDIELIFDGELFNIRYDKYVPIEKKDKYCMWTTETLNLMRVITKMNSLITDKLVSHREMCKCIKIAMEGYCISRFSA